MISKSGTEIWPKLRYHPVQAALWQHTGRFAAVVAGRRSGKTELCKRKQIIQLPIKKPWPDPLYFYILPTYKQAKMVAWYSIERMIPKNWLTKNGVNRTELSFTTIWGSKLYIVGADKPQRLEGVSADWVVIDESSDQKEELFTKTIVPMLADRDGVCYRIGVPKRSGIGRVGFRDFYNRGMQGLDNIQSFYWRSSDILTPQQIEEAKQQLDPLEFAEQFEAKWHDVGSNVYHSFSNDNISDHFEYDPTQPIVVGCDFNVDPMCWTLGHYIEGKVYIFDELFIRDTNTPRTMDYLWSMFREHLAGWEFYGDATARARKTAATQSDYLIIKNDARFGQPKIYFPPRNPNLRDRFASVNKAFKNASGDISLYIHPRCKRLINDLNSVSYKEGTTELEDYRGTDIGHISDALGYVIHHLMPLKLEYTAAPVIWSA